MAEVLNISFASRTSRLPPPPPLASPPQSASSSRYPSRLCALNRNVQSCKNAKITCLFRDNSRQEQARKALESALGGKNGEFEKWNEQLNKKEKLERELGGSGGGKGGWFGWLGGGGDDHFWQEAQQTSITLLAILVMYLLIAKGDVLFATVVNPLLYALRHVRVSLVLASKEIMKRISPATHAKLQSAEKEQVVHTNLISAKERVLRKWGN